MFASPVKDPTRLLLALVLFLGTVLCYGEVRGFGFLEYDDDDYVTANARVREGLSPGGLAWAATSVGEACNWHPLTWASHMLDVSLFGLDAPGAHHWMSVTLHGINAALLFGLLVSVTGARVRSLLVALLFAWHPLRVESVAWISERKDVLAGTCLFACLWAYADWARVRARGAPARGRWALVVACAALGLLAKPVLVVLPLLLLAFDHWPLGRRGDLLARVREKGVLFLLAGASAALTLLAQSRGGCTAFLHEGVSLGGRLANAAIASLQYLRASVMPTDLAVFYPHPAVVRPEESRLVTGLLAALALAAASALAWRGRRRLPMVWAGWCWYLATLLPVIGLVQVGGQAMADRYTYLALVGPAIALVWGVDALVRGRPLLRAACVLAGCAAGLQLARMTVRQVEVWRDTRTLFTHALAVTEDNYVAHANLGMLDGRAAQAALRAGRAEEGRALLSSATEHLRAALDVVPSFYEGRLDLGNALILAEDDEGALAELDAAVALRPGAADAHFQRGWVLARLGRWGDAEEALLHARELGRTDAAIDRLLNLVRREQERTP